MDVADAAMEKQRVLSALVRKMNATPSAVDLGKEKTTIPTPLQVFQAILNSLPPFKLPPLPPFLPVLVFPTSKSTAASEALKTKPPPKVSEEVIVPVEVEEATSPQRDNEHGFLF